MRTLLRATRTLRLCGIAAAVCAAAAGLAACGGSGNSSRSSAPHPDARRFLSVDAATRTAEITLVAGYDESVSGFNIDGAFKGSLLFAVPAGWRIAIRCVNRSREASYACVVASSPGARSHVAGVDILHPSGGLAPGSQVVFTFPAPAPALYRLGMVSGSPPSRQPTGMWVVLKVNDPRAPGARRPYVRWLR